MKAIQEHYFVNSVSYNTGEPKAYLNYILFDASYTGTPQFGYVPVPISAATRWEKLSMEIPVPAGFNGGHAYIYVTNESNFNVFFDDFLIVHEKSPMALRVTESADYYPFGLVIEGTRYVDESRKVNSYGYQGDYAEFDARTGWNRFALRGNYDSRLGRWQSGDPYAQYSSQYLGIGNNPISGIDPDGGFFVNWGAALVGFGEGFLAGAAIGSGIDLLNDGKFNDGLWWKVGLAGGLVGGILGSASGDIAISWYATPWEKFRAQVNVALGKKGELKLADKVRRVTYGPGARVEEVVKEITFKPNGIATIGGLEAKAKHIVEGTTTAASRIIVKDQSGGAVSEYTPRGGNNAARTAVLDPAETFRAFLPKGSTGATISTGDPIYRTIDRETGQMVTRTTMGLAHTLFKYHQRPQDMIKLRIRSIRVVFNGGRIFR